MKKLSVNGERERAGVNRVEGSNWSSMVEKGEKRTSVEAAQEDETVGKTHPFKRPKPFVTFQLN